ncbi:hypothetical protein FRC01_010729 [Tulasnella sp. 417]|nr:hypothetical protein FRC01_010729 [Tulasnella sp. 417]
MHLPPPFDRTPALLVEALSMIKDFAPADVANALQDFHHAIPDFHSNPTLQAQLISSWETDFAAQVLNNWKPFASTWPELLGTTKDAAGAVRLMLSAFDPADVRPAIASAGDLYGGARRILLMQTLRTELDHQRPGEHPATGPVLGSVHKASLTTGNRLPLTSSNNRTPVLPRSKDKLAEQNVPTHKSPFAAKTKAATTSTEAGLGVHRRPNSNQPTSHDWTKENMVPLTSGEWNNPSTRPKSTLPVQIKGSCDIPGLLAADDARRRVPRTPITPNLPSSKPIASPFPANQSPLHKGGSSVDPSQSVQVDAVPLSDSKASETESKSGSEVDEFKTPTVQRKRSRREHGSQHASATSVRTAPKDVLQAKPVPSGQAQRRKSTPAQSLSSDEEGTFGRPQREVKSKKTPRGPLGPDGAKDREDDGGTSEEGPRRMYSDFEEDGRSSNESDDDGKKEEGGAAADVDESPLATKENYPDGFVDPLTPNPWDWDQETNDKKVELWEVDDLILRDPRSTAPVRANWMYEARKGDMTDEEYSAKVKEEHRKFMEIPVACRAAVGQMWYRDSKLDWEIRVFLAPLVYKYAMLKIDIEEAEELGDKAEVKTKEAERKALATDAMVQLFARFPDCSPNHELRRIEEKYGRKELGKYTSKFRNKFTSDAGRMKVLYQKSEANGGSIGAKISLSTIMEILGRKRVRIAFHLWGGSTKGGKAECDEEINEQMEEWFDRHPTAKPQEASHHRIKVVQEVRKERFKHLDDDVKDMWRKRAKSIHKPANVEEEQCFVEACLPYVLDLLNLLAERGNMHFVLLASSQGTCDIPIAIQEFSRKDAEQSIFLSTTDGLGARIRADYTAYALERYGGGIEDAVVRVATNATLDTDDDIEDDDSGPPTGEPNRKTKHPVAPTFVPPFKPDLVETSTIAKKARAISDYIVLGVKMLHRARISWDNMTKHAARYIFTERMPMDPDAPGQRLQIQRPSAMTDTRVRAFFQFLVSSYDGSLPEDKSFRFKLDARYMNIPTPTVPDDPNVHHAGVSAAKTKIPKRVREGGEKKGKKTNRSKSRTNDHGKDGEYENYEGMMMEVDAAVLDDALRPSNSSRKGKSLRIESPPQSPRTIGKPPLRTSADVTNGEPAPNSQLPDGPPDKPVRRPRPRTKIKDQIELGTDELSHPLLLPDDAESAEIWLETKETLDIWGKNMTHSGKEDRKVPFISGLGIKLSVDPPAALYSSLSVLQLWNVFQGDNSEEYDVTFPPNLGLTTVLSKHHVSETISLIFDPSEPLPSAKFAYHQSQFSPDATSAFFLQIETSLSNFMDEVVASEDSVLDSNLNLLQGMRMASFMRGTGFIRDVSLPSANTKRTGAISNRFVQIVAAVAFTRYMKLVLGRVAELYATSSLVPETKLMWNELLPLWGTACATLARSLVDRRADLFLIRPEQPSLPRKFQPLLEYAFNARPWWTPGPKGVPGLISIPNKQAVASETFFKYLNNVNWTKSSFLERGRILLLLFFAAIQIETRRVIGDEQQPERSPARLMTEALRSFRQVVEDSSEEGPTEQSILIPSEPITTWVSKWEMECQIMSESGVGPSPSSPPPQVVKSPNDPDMTLGSLKSVAQDEQTIDDGSEMVTEQVLNASTSEDLSMLPPEDEDPTLSAPGPKESDIVHGPPPPSPSPVQKSVVPAVRSLEDAELPPGKKRRVAAEVETRSLDQTDGGVRKLRSATGPKPAQLALSSAPGRLPVSTEANIPTEPSASVARRTRAATAAAAATVKPRGASTTKKTRTPGSSKRGGPKKGGK